MHHFHNLLYVSHGIFDETSGLKQALSMVRNNNADMSILVISPEFPKEFPEYNEKYQESISSAVAAGVNKVKEDIKLEKEMDIKIIFVTDKSPAASIIKYVIQHGHDLLIKESEAKAGFKAIDMDLLRKCPVPVWLCRPITQSRTSINVAVAIDPEIEEASARDLSIRMLQLSRSIADSCSRELQIISCWDYIFEEYLKDNAWFRVSESQIASAVSDAQREHRDALEALIKESRKNGEQYVHHLRGKPDEVIPSFVKERKIDILVMGTVARTGVQGLLIGNTAENIMQKLTCSLIALKPQGFVSPIK